LFLDIGNGNVPSHSPEAKIETQNDLKLINREGSNARKTPRKEPL
jgi:hypothetical protein